MGNPSIEFLEGTQYIVFLTVPWYLTKVPTPIVANGSPYLNLVSVPSLHRA